MHIRVSTGMELSSTQRVIRARMSRAQHTLFTARSAQTNIDSGLHHVNTVPSNACKHSTDSIQCSGAASVKDRLDVVIYNAINAG